MNEKTRRGLSERGRSQARRAWGIYLLALMAWVTMVLLIAFLGMLACSSFTWQYGLLYRLLTWVRDYIVFVCAIVTLIGWVFISYFFVARPVGQLEALTDAAERLARPSEEPIVLPPALAEAEGQLNAAREQALRDARAARDAEQRKNDLVVYLAHDLKTPLTSVIGYLSVLRDEPQISPELRARYTSVALEKAERLEDLINEFFDITRFNLSHIELERRPTDLIRMLQQVASEFQPILSEKGLACRLDLPEKLVGDCDPDKLARVFDNLLRNACHYSFPDTEVTISGHAQGDRAVLVFANQGPDIPPEKLSRIFEQFFRLDTARSSASGGAGLGLAIAKEIVELHGGAISAGSTDGQITFTVILPLEAPQENRKNSTGQS